jgi:conjugative transfer signal peptidase TraF
MKTRQWLLLILFGLIILNFTHIVYFNIFTHSLPYGIYMKINGTPQRGDYAASCLTQEIAQYGIDRRYLAPGNCDTGTVRVLKMIKGLPGDYFVVKNGFLELNEYSYPIIGKDSSGRTLKVFYKQKEGVLDKGKYILLSDFVKNSWDSRYWGPVSIQFLLKPLWVFENVKQSQISHYVVYLK